MLSKILTPECAVEREPADLDVSDTAASELTDDDYLDQQCDKIVLQQAIIAEAPAGPALVTPSLSSDGFVLVDTSNPRESGSAFSDDESESTPNPAGEVCSLLAFNQTRLFCKFKLFFGSKLCMALLLMRQLCYFDEILFSGCHECPSRTNWRRAVLQV